MDKIFKRYNKILVRLCLKIKDMSAHCGGETSVLKDEEISNIELVKKDGYIDINNLQMAKIGHYSGELGDVDNWDELQDKILRVLTYKYYDADVAVIYYNKGCTAEVSSLSCFEEEMEIDTQILVDYEEIHSYRNVPRQNLEVQVLYRREAATVEHPELVYVDGGSGWRKFWRRLRDLVTFRKCRGGDVSDDDTS